MAPSTRSATAVAALFVAALAAAAAAGRGAAGHSHLDSPRPMTTKHSCRVGGDPPMNCPGPCPTEPSVDWSSQATYERGGSYGVTWARNNHEGGFTRLTLVPKDQWTSAAAHSERAFWYSCWSAGREACPSGDKDKKGGGRCYDDGDGSRFGTTMTIPRVVPDGEYVLGYAWYGGLGDGFTESFFGDYYDCAVVTVAGGAAVQAEEPVVFQPGPGSRFGDKCEATANRLGVCPVEPCRGIKKSLMTSAAFDGKTPAPLTAALFGGTPAAGGGGVGGQYDAAAGDGGPAAGQAAGDKPAGGQYGAGGASPAGYKAPPAAPAGGPYTAGGGGGGGPAGGAGAAAEAAGGKPPPAGGEYGEAAAAAGAGGSPPGAPPAGAPYGAAGGGAPAGGTAAGQGPPAGGPYKGGAPPAGAKAPAAPPAGGPYEAGGGGPGGGAAPAAAGAKPAGAKSAAGPYGAGDGGPAGGAGAGEEAAGAAKPPAGPYEAGGGGGGGGGGAAAAGAKTPPPPPQPAGGSPYEAGGGGGGGGDGPVAGAKAPPPGGAADLTTPPPFEGDGAANLGHLSVDGLAAVDTRSGTISVPSAQVLSAGVAASPTATLIAEVRGPANYVEFYVNGAWASTESYAPYAIAGNTGGSFTPWPPLATGGTSVSVKVLAYDVDRNRAERTFKITIKP